MDELRERGFLLDSAARPCRRKRRIATKSKTVPLYPLHQTPNNEKGDDNESPFFFLLFFFSPLPLFSGRATKRLEMTPFSSPPPPRTPTLRHDSRRHLEVEETARSSSSLSLICTARTITNEKATRLSRPCHRGRRYSLSPFSSLFIIL